MPTIVTQTVAVAAGGSSSLLSGNMLEQLPYDAQIDVAIVAEAAGLLASVQSGTDVLMDDGPPIIVAANGMPRFPDDFYLTDVASAGEKIVIKVRNPTAGAINSRAVVRITPL